MRRAGTDARRIGATMLLAALPVVAGAMQGQSPRATGIEQIPSGAAPAVQPPLPAPDVRPPAQVGGRDSGEAPAQVSSGTAKRGLTPQVNREPRSARALPQLYRGGRTAQPSDPLSSPQQSAPSAVVRLEGKDRCDPDAAAAAVSAACRRVIETRSGEFVRPNPLVLSPEQKLMVDARLRQAPMSAESAAQRIGRNDVDAGSSDAQSVASLVLAPPVASPAKPTEKDTPTGLDAEVLSVIQALAGANPTTVVVTPP